MISPSGIVRSKIEFLYTDIGRGHPSYLDGIIEAMVRSGEVGAVSRSSNVLEQSRGISRLAWKAVRWLYREGSSGGVIGHIYRNLRHNTSYNESSVAMRVLGRDLCSQYMDGNYPLVVAHPLLVGLLRGRSNIIYQHGELVVPEESLVHGAMQVFVPASEVADQFMQFGYTKSQVIVTGLCIEPSLVAQVLDSYDLRQERLYGSGSLTGAFFSSGAEPEDHVKSLVEGAWSCVSKGHRTIIFAKAQGCLAEAIQARFGQLDSNFLSISGKTPVVDSLPEAVLITHRNRREENVLTAQLFTEFDFFFAPAHERTNWAVGLGLPMFVVGPDFGSYAPLNHRLLIDKGVAEMLEDEDQASQLGEKVHQMKINGILAEMSRRGFQPDRINGFETIARFLSEQHTKT